MFPSTQKNCERFNRWGSLYTTNLWTCHSHVASSNCPEHLCTYVGTSSDAEWMAPKSGSKVNCCTDTNLEWRPMRDTAGACHLSFSTHYYSIYKTHRSTSLVYASYIHYVFIVLFGLRNHDDLNESKWLITWFSPYTKYSWTAKTCLVSVCSISFALDINKSLT